MYNSWRSDVQAAEDGIQSDDGKYLERATFRDLVCRPPASVALGISYIAPRCTTWSSEFMTMCEHSAFSRSPDGMANSDLVLGIESNEPLAKPSWGNQ